MAGAVVSLYPKFRFHTYFVAKTDADGRYRIGAIWSDREANRGDPDWGKYTVSVRHPNLTAAAREAVFDDRQSVRDFDFATVPGTEIAGRLLDPHTLAPVADSVVYVDSASGRQTFLTNTDGGFRARVAPGKISASFSLPPRNRFVSEGHADGLPSTLNALAGGERLPVEIYLPGPLGRLGTVRGRVNGADGAPAARCQIVASSPERLQSGRWAGNFLRGVVTDEAGHFTIHDFPIGPEFTLNARAEGNTATGTLPVQLVGSDELDLPTPVVLQPTAPGSEFLLTDRRGKPRANLDVAVGPLRDDQNYPIQVERLRSDREGVLRVPRVVPGARYAITTVDGKGVTRVVNAFDAPAAGAAAPAAPRRTLVIDPEGLVRLLDADGKPLSIKRFVEYGGTAVFYGRRSRWMNELPVLGHEGTDAVIPWDKITGNRGEPSEFLVETDDGSYVRAAGPEPIDGSNLFVIRATEVLRSDLAPDPTIAGVAANELAGRVVTPEGEPIAGAVMEMPGVYLQETRKPVVASGADGVFRTPMPAYRFAYLTVAKEGWATAFVTDARAGQGFRVVMRKDTWLRGTVGGENPGRVSFVLTKNKFTKDERSYHHEVQNLALRFTTDEHGAYSLPVDPGRYRWEASSADGRFASGEIGVDPGRTVDLGAALKRGFDVTFELVDCQSGQPVPGVEVAIYEQRADRVYSPREGSTLTSDAAGRIHWENLPPGEKRFSSTRMTSGQGARGREQSAYSRWWRADEPNDWERVDYARQPPTGQDHSTWLTVHVQLGMPPVRILMERGVKISGRVVDADGKGAPYASIQAVTQRGQTLSNFSAQTDQEGNFLAYLPAGNGLLYHLCAYTFPNGETPAPGATALSEPFQSRPGDERTFRLVMGRGGWFTGRLVGSDGRAAGGFKVTATAEDGLESYYAARIVTAGADGRFRLGPLRPGKYKVTPGTGNASPLQKLPGAAATAGEIVADDEARDLGDIVLPPGRNVRSDARLENGQDAVNGARPARPGLHGVMASLAGQPLPER